MSSGGKASAGSKRPKVRLVLYSGPSKFKLATIHSEYSIDHVDEDNYAFVWNATKVWYAIALEVDGRRVPFRSSEHVVLKVLDERDPEAGVAVIGDRTATNVHKEDGMHYFSALEFRKVGEYRVIFAMTPKTIRSEWVDAGVRPRPLAFEVRVEDPAYEAAQRARITAEMPEAMASVRKKFAKENQYPSAPLTQKEK